MCAYPFSCRLRDGSVLCAYRAGKEKHSRDGVLLTQRSTDGGMRWSEPAVVFDGLRGEAPESVHTVGVVCQLCNGDALAIFKTVAAVAPDAYIFSEEGRRLRTQLYFVRSFDGGQTWPKVEPKELLGGPRDTYIGSQPVLLPSGELFIPVEATGEHKQQFAMGTIASADGATLSRLFTCAKDESGEIGYGDPRLALLPDGRIVMLLWTYRNATEETLLVHRCVSLDSGRSWGAPLSCGVRSQIMYPLALDDRRMIAASNVRTPPAGIYLWYSSDGGERWTTHEPIHMWDARQEKISATRAAAVGPASPESTGRIWNALPGFTFGTPELVPLGDDECLLLYYATVKGITHVRACRFAVSF